MRTAYASPLACLLLAGCLWNPAGAGARPRVGLESVERSPRFGLPPVAPRPIVEPGVRGYFFSDSLIALRTEANLATIRFRLWNRGTAPLRIVWDEPSAPGPPGECPAAAGSWELRRIAQAEDSGVVGPGHSRETQLTPAVRAGAVRGQPGEPVPLQCLVFDPAEPRAALRVAVETPGARFVYTFWYHLMEPPREDMIHSSAASPEPP